MWTTNPEHVIEIVSKILTSEFDLYLDQSIQLTLDDGAFAAAYYVDTIIGALKMNAYLEKLKRGASFYWIDFDFYAWCHDAVEGSKVGVARYNIVETEHGKLLILCASFYWIDFDFYAWCHDAVEGSKVGVARYNIVETEHGKLLILCDHPF